MTKYALWKLYNSSQLEGYRCVKVERAAVPSQLGGYRCVKVERATLFHLNWGDIVVLKLKEQLLISILYFQKCFLKNIKSNFRIKAEAYPELQQASKMDNYN